MKKILGIVSITAGLLYGTVLDKTRFYIAYDKKDPTKYALIMPMVEKVYTHIAGKVTPKDLTDITSQFATFPTYKNGEVCFSKLKTTASKKAGADIMKNQCYECKFFYVQGEKAIASGYPFLLYYKPAKKLYEGLAGKATTFKVVRDGDKVQNENSITQTDFTLFKFDVVNAKVLIGDDAKTTIKDNTGNIENNDSTVSDITMPPSVPDLNLSEETILTPPSIPELNTTK